MDERFPVSSDAHEELPLVSYGIIRDQEILECIVGGSQTRRSRRHTWC